MCLKLFLKRRQWQETFMSTICEASGENEEDGTYFSAPQQV